MRQVWKFPVELGLQHIEMPSDATPLAFGIQNSYVVWAEVSTDAPKRMREVLVIGTGMDKPQGFWTYLGTVQDGAYVWHCYFGLNR